MGIFTLDQERCAQCGACARICGMGVIQMAEGSYPQMVGDGCIGCGHCEAVCTQQALLLAPEYAEVMAPSQQTGKVSMNPEQIGLYMRGRRSIRNFRDKAIDHETFESLLDIARFAPSAGNGQPIEWIVVESPEEVHRLTGLMVELLNQLPADAPERSMFGPGMVDYIIGAWSQGADIVCRNAPHLVLAHTKPDAMMPLVDGTIALTYLELAAPSFGLGTCWAGFLYMMLNTLPELKKAFGIPEGNVPLGGLMLGYPKYNLPNIPPRNRAKVQWLS